MRKIFIIILLISVSLVSCISNGNNKKNQDNNKDIMVMHDFSEYGFTIEAPCQMEDVSSQANTDFLINYGGVTDKDNLSKI